MALDGRAIDALPADATHAWLRLGFTAICAEVYCVPPIGVEDHLVGELAA